MVGIKSMGTTHACCFLYLPLEIFNDKAEVKANLSTHESEVLAKYTELKQPNLIS